MFLKTKLKCLHKVILVLIYIYICEVIAWYSEMFCLVKKIKESQKKYEMHQKNHNNKKRYNCCLSFADKCLQLVTFNALDMKGLSFSLTGKGYLKKKKKGNNCTV